MTFNLSFTRKAEVTLLDLEKAKSKKGLLKQVKKVLGFMQTNLRHPSLHTHKFEGFESPLGEVFESYAQNDTPGAYRILWSSGPKKSEITILIITPLPNSKQTIRDMRAVFEASPWFISSRARLDTC